MLFKRAVSHAAAVQPSRDQTHSLSGPTAAQRLIWLLSSEAVVTGSSRPLFAHAVSEQSPAVELPLRPCHPSVGNAKLPDEKLRLLSVLKHGAPRTMANIYSHPTNKCRESTPASSSGRIDQERASAKQSVRTVCTSRIDFPSSSCISLQQTHPSRQARQWHATTTSAPGDTTY